MGNSTTWLRRLFGGNKPAEPKRTKAEKKKKRWQPGHGFFRSSTKDNDRSAEREAAAAGPCEADGGCCSAEVSNARGHSYAADDANKHAIAVAAATAAVAEAALAAAKAAAAVVRLTSSGGRHAAAAAPEPATVPSVGCRREDFAALKIQAGFRAYLARRALKALKGLVKLQALVRGHLVRKQTANMLRRMQALVRVQARARANRALQYSPLSNSSHYPTKSLLHHQLGSPNSSKHALQLHQASNSPIRKRCTSNANVDGRTQQAETQMVPNWLLEQWVEDHSWNHQRKSSTSLKPRHGTAPGLNDERNDDKILEIDTGKPRQAHGGRNNAAALLRGTQKPIPSLSTDDREVALKPSIGFDDEEMNMLTAESSPQVLSARSSRFEGSGRRGAFTPGRSESSKSFHIGYLDHPNYMANTESYRAKVRSLSAPRQRIYEFESHGGPLVKRTWDSGVDSDRGWDYSRGMDYALSGRF